MKNEDNIVMWAAVAIGAYLLWNWWQNRQSTAAPTGSTTSTTAAAQQLGPANVPVYTAASQAAYMAAYPQVSNVGSAASLPAFTGPITQGS